MREPPTIHRLPYGGQEVEFMIPPWFDAEIAQGPAAGEHDVVIAGVGAPHDGDLRQALAVAVRACSPSAPLVRRGGVIVMPAQLSEGSGDPPAATGPSPDLARLREHCLVVVASSEAPEVVRLAGLRAAVDVEEALEIAYEHLGRPARASLLIVPRAAQTLPVVTTGAGVRGGGAPGVGAPGREAT